MHFPEDHPFSKFNEYYYLESVSPKFLTYIFKFTKSRGILINIELNNKEKEFHASLYELKFDDDYYFNLTKSCRKVTAETLNDILGYVATIMEVIINGSTK